MTNCGGKHFESSKTEFEFKTKFLFDETKLVAGEYEIRMRLSELFCFKHMLGCYGTKNRKRIKRLQIAYKTYLFWLVNESKANGD